MLSSLISRIFRRTPPPVSYEDVVSLVQFEMRRADLRPPSEKIDIGSKMRRARKGRPRTSKMYTLAIGELYRFPLSRTAVERTQAFRIGKRTGKVFKVRVAANGGWVRRIS